MEFLIELVFEIVINIVAEIFGETIEFGFKKVFGRKPRVESLVVYALFLAPLGFVLGMFSLDLIQPMISLKALQVANVIATPFFIAFMMGKLGRLKEKNNKELLALDHFWVAYIFALSFALARFAFFEVA